MRIWKHIKNRFKNWQAQRKVEVFLKRVAPHMDRHIALSKARDKERSHMKSLGDFDVFPPLEKKRKKDGMTVEHHSEWREGTVIRPGDEL